MSTYHEIIKDIVSFQNKPLQAKIYLSENTEMKTAILYFHGGGFVFGSRTDLPNKYIDHLTNSGVGLVAVDYPLAPETKLPAILKTTNQITKWFVEEFLAEHHLEDYFIMGRSAGGFLALANGVFSKQLSTRPTGIISLYGYYHFQDASFNVPNRHYLNYPKVKDQTVAAQIQDEPIFQSTNQNRYFVYMAARQKGDWLNLFLHAPEEKRELSITKEALKELPPLFLSAATKDPDVPVQQSRQMANIHPEATLHLVDVNEHDFDRTHIETLGIELYEKMTEWLFKQLNV